MLQTVADILRSRGIQGWLVGGSVRDRELGRPSPDLDLVVAADPASVAEKIARAAGAPWFTLSERHGAYRVMGPEGHVDVAAVRGAGILHDLAQRDFTVNAMAAPVGEAGDGLIDPYGGLAHLRSRRLVAVSEHIFADDPLRLMRAARFSHALGLTLDSALTAAVRAQAPLLVQAAPERVTAEIVLTLAAGRSGDAARLWDDLGLLGVMLVGSTEPPDGPTSSLSPDPCGLDRLEAILAEPAAWFPEAAEALAVRLAQPVDGAVDLPVALRLAGLVHQTAPRQAAAVGRRMRLSGAMNSLLARAARMCDDRGTSPPAPVSLARPGRAAILYLWAAAPWEPEVILLTAAAQADAAAAARSLMALWARRTVARLPALPVDGEVLMQELGLGPGPRLGEALRAARLAWEAGEAMDVEQVLAAARGAITRPRG